MGFSPKVWKDEPDHSTPISAAALIDLETRVTTYAVPRLVAAGNLGTTSVLTMASTDLAVWMTGTLTGSLALTIANQPALSTARLLLTQDGTGGHTLSVNGSAVTINNAPSSVTIVDCFSDGTDLYVRGS